MKALFKKKIFIDPQTFYQNEFSGIKTGREWTNVICCFHDERNPSLSLNLVSGGYFCHACGEKGGSVVSFFMQRYSLGFKDAIRELEMRYSW